MYSEYECLHDMMYRNETKVFGKLAAPILHLFQISAREWH